MKFGIPCVLNNIEAGQYFGFDLVGAGRRRVLPILRLRSRRRHRTCDEKRAGEQYSLPGALGLCAGAGSAVAGETHGKDSATDCATLANFLGRSLAVRSAALIKSPVLRLERRASVSEPRAATRYFFHSQVPCAGFRYFAMRAA